MSIELVRKMSESVEAAQHTEWPRAMFRFGHAENVLPLVLQLGLYRDQDPLTAESAIDAPRLWRTSRIAPFGTNVAVVLYRCAAGFFVQVRHNERAVALPDCGSPLPSPVTHACPLQQFLRLHEQLLEQTFESVCA